MSDHGSTPESGDDQAAAASPDQQQHVDELRQALEDAVEALGRHLGDASAVRRATEGAGRLGATVGREVGRAGRRIEHAGRELGGQIAPAWNRVTEGENRWPITAVVAVAVALQVVIPRRFNFHPFWILPALEAALLVGLAIANPTRVGGISNTMRRLGIVLIGLTSIANGWSAVLLIRALIGGHAGQDAGPLLATGGAIWLTNVIVFALWYWELDRGGPAARANNLRPYPDFYFPQMDIPDLVPPRWEPTFWDYFYLSFTNATAFSPTDVMPLSRWAKLAMLAQSAVSLATVALVIARAVNILK